MRAKVYVFVLMLVATGLDGCTGARKPTEQLYTFNLVGGSFYGPGPIVPDTLLPDGHLVNIHFDPRELRGYAEFFNDGRKESKLSDGKTRINQNIDAGRLKIGGGFQTVLLVAVEGGPNRGTEQYYLDEDYRFVWRVDLALDPGFEEGIIRVDDFILHTGVTRIATSLQTRSKQTGGYDQAGSLKSGQFLLGRVGDFDQNGYIDGILVAAPNVPMAADLLPGAPVGNRRGFNTNIPITPNLSAELILRGMLGMPPAFEQAAAQGDSGLYNVILNDAGERIAAVHTNMLRALNSPAWERPEVQQTGRKLLDRVSDVEKKAFPAFHPSTEDRPPHADPGIAGFRTEITLLVESLASINRAIGDTLPTNRRPSVLTEHFSRPP